LNNVTQKELNYIMDQLNHRPRKTLGFKTPYNLFFKKNILLTFCTSKLNSPSSVIPTPTVTVV
jgi:hypothetical protein